MGRVLGAVIAGYVTMVVVVFASFSAAYLLMGTERAFEAGSYGVSRLWLLTSLALSLVAALAGGRVCARIGGTSRAVPVLAGMVVVLGLVMAVPALQAPGDPAAMERSGDVGNFAAMQKAQQPHWMTLTLPALGAAGGLRGGRRS